MFYQGGRTPAGVDNTMNVSGFTGQSQLVSSISYQGHNGSTQGYNGSIQGHNGSIQGHNGSIQGHNGSIQGHNGSIQGHNGSIQGHNGSIQGHNGSIQGHTGSIQGHNGSIQGHNASFLPAFLLGESSHQANLARTTASTWPSLGQVPTSSGQESVRRENLLSSSEGPPVGSLFANTMRKESSATSMFNNSQSFSPTQLRRTVSSLGGSPPNKGLFERPSVPNQASLPAVNQSYSSRIFLPQTSPSNIQRNQSSDNPLDFWITVFGFAPGAQSFILQQFSQFGTIVRHVTSVDCNWIHIQYLTGIQAGKALSRDGKILGGCMKLAVVPCTDKILQEEKISRSGVGNQSLNDTPATRSDSSYIAAPIRPLTAAYVTTSRNLQVSANKPVPQRDTSVLSKLKEYMFGY